MHFNFILAFGSLLVCTNLCFALPSPGLITQTIISGLGQPTELPQDIDNTILFSFQNTYPSLVAYGIQPVNDRSQTRIVAQGSEIIANLSSTLSLANTPSTLESSPSSHTDVL